MKDQDNLSTPLNGEDDIIQKSEATDILTSHVEPLPVWKYTLINFVDGLKNIGLWAIDLIISIFSSIGHFIKLIGKALKHLTIGTYLFFENKIRQFKYNDRSGRLSFFVFGASSFKHKQYANGALFILFEIGYIVFLALGGAYNMYMLGSLGLKTPGPDPSCDDMFCEWVDGDNSILILIYGLLSVMSIFLFLYIWNRSVNSGYNNYRIDNYIKYKNLFDNNQEASQQIDDLVKEKVYNGCTRKEIFTDSSSIKEEAIKKIALIGNPKEDKFIVNNSKFILRNSVIHSYDEYRHIIKEENRLNNENQKLEELKNKIEANKSKYQNDENALRNYEVDSKVKINKQVTRINKIKNRLHELNLKHSNFAKKESVLNGSKYGKFNDYYKVVAKYENEIKFFSNYDAIIEKLNSLAGKYEEVNEANKASKINLVNSLDEKIAAINANYDQILNAKKELINELKTINEQKANELKGVKDPALINEIEDKYFTRISTLSGRIHGMPEDKNIHAMRKEEIKDVKKAIARDKKYLKTNFTDVSYSREEIINYLLLEYKFEYNFAKEVVSNLFIKTKDGSVTRMSKEEVETKLQALQNELETYISSHPDKFVGRPKSFKEQINSLKNENFHLTMLTLPTLGILLFTITPLLFSILVAFTNYSTGHIPPTQLFTWIGFENFITLFNAPPDSIYADLPGVLGKTLGWTIIWTFISTFSNYFLGILLALIINKKGIRLKKVWRTVFVLTIAIPQFISLMSIGVLLKDSGAIGTWWNSVFGYRLGFASSTANQAIVSKIIILLVNIWVGIPYTLLSTTGILLNIPSDLYESATVDGAGPTTQFTKITLPYILFVTGPYLITQFVGNINNFNVIYFLTGGGPNIRGTSLTVGYTDLLVTFLYKMITSNSNPQYGIASTVGIVIFVICSFFSIIMYNKTGAIQEEDQFQ